MDSLKNIKITTGNIYVKFNGILRDYQYKIIDCYIKYIGINDADSLQLGKGGASIEVGCGRGKQY